MILNNNELEAVKDCLKRYIEFNNNRVMERLFNCIRNGIYVTCSMYDEFKSLEDEKEVKIND